MSNWWSDMFKLALVMFGLSLTVTYLVLKVYIMYFI